MRIQTGLSRTNSKSHLISETIHSINNVLILLNLSPDLETLYLKHSRCWSRVVNREDLYRSKSLGFARSIRRHDIAIEKKNTKIRSIQFNLNQFEMGSSFASVCVCRKKGMWNKQKHRSTLNECEYDVNVRCLFCWVILWRPHRKNRQTIDKKNSNARAENPSLLAARIGYSNAGTWSAEVMPSDFMRSHSDTFPPVRYSCDGPNYWRRPDPRR